MHYTFQFGVALANLPLLLAGAALTLELAFLAFWGGAAIGLICGSIEAYGPRAACRIVRIYTVFFMNTPALLQIYFLYYGLPDFHIFLSAFTCVLIGLTLNSGAYLTEIMRAGFVSVRRQELDAAETLGMSVMQQIGYVIVPHIARTIYPALANFFVLLLLGSSISAVFGVSELTGTAIDLATESYRWIELFLIVAAIYVILTFAASLSLALVGRVAFRVRARVF